MAEGKTSAFFKKMHIEIDKESNKFKTSVDMDKALDHPEFESYYILREMNPHRPYIEYKKKYGENLISFECAYQNLLTVQDQLDV